MPDPSDSDAQPGFGPESIPIGGADDPGRAQGDQPPPAEEERAGDAYARAAGIDPEATWRALRDGLGAAAEASRHGEGMQCVELCPICRAADILRASGPPELRGQINEFQREALLTLRTLLDHYLERIEEPGPRAAAEEIPIE